MTAATHRSGDQAARVVAVELCKACSGHGKILTGQRCRPCGGSGHLELLADGTWRPMERGA